MFIVRTAKHALCLCVPRMCILFYRGDCKRRWRRQHCQVNNNNNNNVVNCNRQPFRRNRRNNYCVLVARAISRKTTGVETNILYDVVI